MNEIYWITRFDSLHNIGIVIFFIFLIIAVILCNISITMYGTGEENQKHILRKNAKYSLIVSIIGVLMWTFIPTEKEALLIYGVGGTVDYIKQNPTAKQLPDKCVKALDKWVDSWIIKNDSIK